MWDLEELLNGSQQVVHGDESVGSSSDDSDDNDMDVDMEASSSKGNVLVLAHYYHHYLDNLIPIFFKLCYPASFSDSNSVFWIEFRTQEKKTREGWEFKWTCGRLLCRLIARTGSVQIRS
jgi:hypothetical protein